MAALQWTTWSPLTGPKLVDFQFSGTGAVPVTLSSPSYNFSTSLVPVYTGNVIDLALNVTSMSEQMTATFVVPVRFSVDGSEPIYLLSLEGMQGYLMPYGVIQHIEDIFRDSPPQQDSRGFSSVGSITFNRGTLGHEIQRPCAYLFVGFTNKLTYDPDIYLGLVFGASRPTGDEPTSPGAERM